MMGAIPSMGVTHFLVWSFILIGLSTAVKVIVIPQNINSHVGFHARLAYTLANEGHEVGILLPSNVKEPKLLTDTSVKIVRYPVKNEIPFINTEESCQSIIAATFTDSVIDQFRIQDEMVKMMTESWDEECHSMLTDDGIRQHMDEMQYDITIMDVAALGCHAALPYRRNIPMIMYGVLSFEWKYRVPTLPSIVPPMISSGGVDFSFWKRLENALIYIIYGAIITFDRGALPGPDPPMSFDDVYAKSVFYFALDDVSIALPRPLMPNVEYMGDLIPQPGQPLSSSIAAFVESATHGVVIASFGSFFDFLPVDVGDKFCDAFKAIPQKVIWKLKNKTMCEVDPDKVMLLDWLPQNDLLAHENVKLFVTHCGRNSILESIYHATPILGFPLSIDQPFNAMLVEHLGMGDQMKIIDFTKTSLTRKISEIIQNKTIQETVNRASAVMRHKRDKPEKRVSYWVSHLVEHGNEHLKTKAFQLNLFQFYCLDVILFILLCIHVVLFVLYYCTKYSFKCVRRCCCGKKLKKE